jgi:ribosomal protein S12
MPTINQLVRKAGKVVEYTSKSRALESSPQKKRSMYKSIYDNA